MRRRRTLWKGVLAGLAGGLAASWAMNQFQSALSKIASANSDDGRDSKSRGKQLYDIVAKQHSSPAGAHVRDAERGSEQGSGESEDATVKAAQKIASFADHKLSNQEKKVAGPAVHYGFGSAMGALYGAAGELFPPVRAIAGLPFGATVWLLADEVAVPALKLSRPPQHYSAGKHAQALAAHAVYGATTELVRRGVRALL